MNRNIMYELLQESGLKQLAKNVEENKRKGKQNIKKPYYFDFVLDQEKNQYKCYVITDWGYIKNIGSIAICKNEVVIRGRFESMQVNINYKDIKTFEVKVYDDEDELL